MLLNNRLSLTIDGFYLESELRKKIASLRLKEAAVADLRGLKPRAADF